MLMARLGHIFQYKQFPRLVKPCYCLLVSVFGWLERGRTALNAATTLPRDLQRHELLAVPGAYLIVRLCFAAGLRGAVLVQSCDELTHADMLCRRLRQLDLRVLR